MSNKLTKSLGFTLIELIVTISIVAILVGIAIPSFSSVIRSTRLTTYANELVTSLNLARSEAVKRGVQVSVRRKGSTNQNWDSGWDIFTDLDGDGILDTVDTLLKTYPALTNGFTLRTGTAGYQDFAAYLPSGLSLSSIGDTFRLCDSSADTLNSRAIEINAVGRSRTYQGTTACP
ncbi:GspH/FimT family pseudopilin [Methylobacter sp.]|uniref:GspH/FimT family pseudopilin n=1 Tax=Methylobacter sp. TaxID=2051955 RepID=UPI00121223F7|nr:GspH/FimT family pseudopilin [Methylobacter sp.]TAK62529.1 MAG: prepilin-type N-terminal cleavage/methylation domain-containing protein [Methylobacter sp.]